MRRDRAAAEAPAEMRAYFPAWRDPSAASAALRETRWASIGPPAQDVYMRTGSGADAAFAVKLFRQQARRARGSIPDAAERRTLVVQRVAVWPRGAGVLTEALGELLCEIAARTEPPTHVRFESVITHPMASWCAKNGYADPDMSGNFEKALGIRDPPPRGLRARDPSSAPPP